MAKSKRYILDIFANRFFTYFIPFFIIISMVFIIRLSVLSSKINLTFMELSTLFYYSLPEIFFFTIPLVFIASLITTLSKLSESNEIIALFTLGIRPKKIILFFLPLAILVTFLLTFLALVSRPIGKQNFKNFKYQKAIESQLKVAPKKLSQNFGEYNIFIEDTQGKKYKNLTLFINKKDFKELIIAKEGELLKNKKAKSFILKLNDGTIIKDNSNMLQYSSYNTLKLYNYFKKEVRKIEDIKEFWKNLNQDKKEMLFYTITIAISPLLLFIFLINISIFNPRYQKNRSFFYITLAISIIYFPALYVRENAKLPILIAIFIIWIVISIISYIKLSKRF